MNSLTAFLEKLRDEPDLQQRLSAIFALPEAERIPAFRALSREFGVTKADLRPVPDVELSQDDLANVSGGNSPNLPEADGEVRAALAALFASHGQAYQSLSDQAAALHAEFARALESGAQSYS